MTPLRPAQSKLNQRRPQKCPPFCSCPSRFRDSVPALSGPALISLSWALSFGPMLEAPPLLFCFSVRSPSGASPSLKPPDSLPQVRGPFCWSESVVSPPELRQKIGLGLESKMAAPLAPLSAQTPYLRHGRPLVWFYPPWSEDLVVLL